jgi:PST family polysaccharide transporter
MLRFGRNLAGFRMVEWIGSQTDRVLVGLGGAHVVGLYDGARRWGWMPTMEVGESITEVAVSSFSRAQDRPPALRRLVRGAISATLSISLPVTAYLFLETEGAVRILFGDRWLGAVPYMRYMCFGAFFAALSRPTGWIFVSLGRTRRQFRWGLFQTAVIFGSLLVGSISGPMGVAAGYAAAHTFLAFPTIWFCLRGTPITLRDYLGASLRPAIAAVAAGFAAVGTIRLFGDIGTPARMTVEFAVFTTLFLLLWVALPGGRKAARDAWTLIQELGRGAGARLRGATPPTEASVTGD